MDIPCEPTHIFAIEFFVCCGILLGRLSLSFLIILCIIQMDLELSGISMPGIVMVCLIGL